MSNVTLSESEVLEEMRRLVRAGRIAWTKHVLEMLAARGLSKNEATACLLSGFFAEKPFVPNRAGDPEYKFAMEATIDGERLRLAASVIPAKNVVVITIFDL